MGGMAKLFFAYFYILQAGMPKFILDFDNTEFGEFGYRKWYDNCVFWGKDVEQQMSYDSKLLPLHRHIHS